MTDPKNKGGGIAQDEKPNWGDRRPLREDFNRLPPNGDVQKRNDTAVSNTAKPPDPRPKK